MRELHIGLERGKVTEGDRNRERERNWRGKMDTHTYTMGNLGLNYMRL